MANIISKVNVNSTEYSLKDEISGYVTQDHTHTLGDIVPAVSKTYYDTSYYDTTGGTNDGCTFYLMYVHPNGWHQPCKVKFKIRTTIPTQGNSYDSVSWCEIYFRAQNATYKLFNERENTAHYYIGLNFITSAGFNAGYGHAIGINIINASGYSSSSYYRQFELEYYGCEDCTVEVFDAPLKNTGLAGYDTSSTYRNKSLSQNINAVDRGLQESGDNNDFAYYTSDYYVNTKVGTNGVKQRSICTLDSNGLFQSFTTDYGTGTSKTKNTASFRIGAQLYYWDNSSNYTSGQALPVGGLRDKYSLFDLRYSTNCGTSLTPYASVYLVGVPNGSYFTLADTWWTTTLPTSEDGKIYIYLGTVYPDNSSTASSNYRISWPMQHPVLWYKNGALRNYVDSSSTSSGVTSVSVKMNGTTKGTVTSSGTIDLGTVITDVSDKAQRADLGGQDSSYRVTAIALCKCSATDNSAYDSYSAGTIYGHRVNGLYNMKFFSYQADDYYDSANYFNLNVVNTNLELNANLVANPSSAPDGSSYRPCVFTYNSQQYAGILYFSSAAETDTMTFVGDGNFTPFAVDTYDYNASTTLNSEIINSIIYNTCNFETSSKSAVSGGTDVSTVTTGEKYTWNNKQDKLTAGSNISISGTTISATDTTYSAGTGLSLSGTTFNHSNSVTAGTAGTSSATSGSTIDIPYVTYDAQGHVTKTGTHTHTIPSSLPASDVYSWAKASSKPSYSFSEISGRGEEYLAWGGPSWRGSVSPIGAALSSEHSANRAAFINGDCITAEYSSDGGSTWMDYGYSAAKKSWLFTNSTEVPIGRSSSSDAYTTNSRTRLTITAQDGTSKYLYTAMKKMLINVSTSGGMQVLVETRTGTNYKSGGDWSTYGTYSLGGWSGWNDLPLIMTLGGGTDQTGQIWQLRLTFIMTSVNSSYNTTAYVYDIRIYGDTSWWVPSNMSRTGHLYSYDYAQNATFPGSVTVAASTAYTTAQVRNAVLTTTAPTAGASASQANGTLIFVYS